MCQPNSYPLTGRRGFYGLYPSIFQQANLNFNNERELENLKIGCEAIGFTCDNDNFLTGYVTLRDAQQFIQYIATNNVQNGCDMIAFGLSTHGMTGTLQSNGQRVEGLSVLFSCGNTTPVDVLFQPIYECYSLLNRPKIFFIQACRGVHNWSLAGQQSRPLENYDPYSDTYTHSRLDCVSIHAATDGNLAWTETLSLCLRENFQRYKRESLNKIFGRLTNEMSKQERSIGGRMVCLLPEMISSLRKEIYFFDPQVLRLRFE